YSGQDIHVEFQIEPARVRSFVRDLREAVGRLSRYGTFCDLRMVRKDDESFLAYARTDRFTLSPTFHMDPSNEAEIRAMYRRVYDLVVDTYGGTFYLW